LPQPLTIKKAEQQGHEDQRHEIAQAAAGIHHLHLGNAQIDDVAVLKHRCTGQPEHHYRNGTGCQFQVEGQHTVDKGRQGHNEGQDDKREQQMSDPQAIEDGHYADDATPDTYVQQGFHGTQFTCDHQQDRQANRDQAPQVPGELPELEILSLFPAQVKKQRNDQVAIAIVALVPVSPEFFQNRHKREQEKGGHRAGKRILHQVLFCHWTSATNNS
jgi:hypothetical protein